MTSPSPSATGSPPLEVKKETESGPSENGVDEFFYDIVRAEESQHHQERKHASQACKRCAARRKKCEWLNQENSCKSCFARGVTCDMSKPDLRTTVARVTLLKKLEETIAENTRLRLRGDQMMRENRMLRQWLRTKQPPGSVAEQQQPPPPPPPAAILPQPPGEAAAPLSMPPSPESDASTSPSRKVRHSPTRPASAGEPGQRQRSKGKHASKACDSCSDRKRRCERQLDRVRCDACELGNLECNYTKLDRRTINGMVELRRRIAADYAAIGAHFPPPPPPPRNAFEPEV